MITFSDVDDFYLRWLERCSVKASKHWLESMEITSSYCYGRNLYYDEDWDKRAWQSPVDFRNYYQQKWSDLLNEQLR